MGNTIPTSYTKVTREQTQSNFIDGGIYGGKIPHNNPPIVRNGLIPKPIRPVGTYSVGKPIGGGTIKSNIKAKPLKRHKKCNKMQ